MGRATVIPWTDAENAELLRLYGQKGMSRHKIAARLGRSYTTVYDHLRRLRSGEIEAQRAEVMTALRPCIGVLCRGKPRYERMFRSDPNHCFHMCVQCRAWATRNA